MSTDKLTQHPDKKNYFFRVRPKLECGFLSTLPPRAEEVTFVWASVYVKSEENVWPVLQPGNLCLFLPYSLFYIIYLSISFRHTHNHYLSWSMTVQQMLALVKQSTFKDFVRFVRFHKTNLHIRWSQLLDNENLRTRKHFFMYVHT
jgi:hypothetical protein